VYIARFKTDDLAWVQALAELRCTAPPSSPDGEIWWSETARHLVIASRIAGATVTRRITLDPSRRLRQVVVITAPPIAESEVRGVFAGLTRLERLLGGSIQLPTTPAAHDDLLSGVPPLRYSPLDDAFQARGLPVACDFRIAPSLDDLFAAASLAGRGLTYEAHIRAYRPEADAIRAARKIALTLSEASGAPTSIIELQDRLSIGLASASSIFEEYLAADDDDGADAAGRLLLERFRGEYPALAITASLARWVRSGRDDDLSIAVHRHDLEPLSPTELSAAALSSVERDRIVGWRPSRQLAALLDQDDGVDGTPSADVDGPPPLPCGPTLPAPYDGSAPFAFVSYKRQDLQRIVPIIEAVQRLGVPIWYDRGIPGASEWDAVIEDRLSRCRFVLLFASNAAVRSKYVRREVKYADAKDTPLLPILLEDTTFAHGMEMLLTQYQMLDARDAGFDARLGQAVSRLM